MSMTDSTSTFPTATSYTQQQQQHRQITTWQLNVSISDIKLERVLRVSGDLHIGALMLRLVDTINLPNKNWSDYALWWPVKNEWLLNTKLTLDQCGIQANDCLYFQRIHKQLRIELPDLQIVELNVDFSINLFSTILSVCKEIGIRHAEEMSFLRHTDSQSHNDNDISISGSTQLILSPTSKVQNQDSSSSTNSQLSLNKSGSDTTKAHLKLKQVKFKTLFDKAKINHLWLDSSKSLMEQDINENDLLKLRFKYYVFQDLSQKTDATRIDQIYEQAKWSVLTEFFDCTDEELFTFAALQLQIQMQAKHAAFNSNSSVTYSRSNSNNNTIDDGDEDEDDIDAALNKLERTLEISPPITQQPDFNESRQFDLKESLQLIKKPKSTFKRIKSYYFHLNGYCLAVYKTVQDYEASVKPVERYSLKNCEIQADLNVQSNKFGVYLRIRDTDSANEEVYLRFSNAESYAKWLAALKFVAKSKAFDESLYKYEVDTIMSLVNMQKQQKSQQKNGNDANFDPENYVPSRLLKKYKPKQIIDRIMDVSSNLNDFNITETKLSYVKAWQALAAYGVSYFIVKYKSLKAKEEILGVTAQSIQRYDGEFHLLKSWPLNTMKSWNVNWDIKQFDMEFDDENIMFYCVNPLHSKILHEFIGGYIFMSLRQPNQTQIDQEMFFKLTDKR